MSLTFLLERFLGFMVPPLPASRTVEAENWRVEEASAFWRGVTGARKEEKIGLRRRKRGEARGAAMVGGCVMVVVGEAG